LHCSIRAHGRSAFREGDHFRLRQTISQQSGEDVVAATFGRLTLIAGTGISGVDETGEQRSRL
jgi:hypothetical protein